jgi:hypothetical protein
LQLYLQQNINAMVSYAKDQAVRTIIERQRRQNIRQRTERPRQQSIRQEAGQYTLGSKASTRERAKETRRQSIRQGTIDAQASVREENTPYGKASAAGSGHDTLSSKASAKEEASDNGGKASARETNSGKASARTMLARLSATGQPIVVEHINAQTGTVRNFPSNRRRDENH